MSAPGTRPEDVLDQLRQIAREDLEIPPADIERLTLDQPLGDGPALDSLRQVILITRLEDAYGFEFEPADQARLAGLQTLRDLATLIAERAGGPAA